MGRLEGVAANNSYLPKRDGIGERGGDVVSCHEETEIVDEGRGGDASTCHEVLDNGKIGMVGIYCRDLPLVVKKRRKRGGQLLLYQRLSVFRPSISH
jgi:hypothetical protein